MRVFVYVEGHGDRVSLEALLRPIIETGRSRGVGIRFLPLGGKAEILDSAARKAADHILDQPDDWAIALPDLYPMAAFDGTRNAHRSFDELRTLLVTRFTNRADTLGLPQPSRDHFLVHCLKHDLEGLLLAATAALRERLRTGDALRGRWRNPVEDQNDDHPPRRIIEELFAQYRRKPGYLPTVDAPWILGRATVEELVQACPQRFGPLVADLQRIVSYQVPQ